MSQFRLQPLRVPAGWKIKWNNFFEIDENKDVLSSEFSESSLFHSTCHLRDFGTVGIDLGWSAANGNYVLYIIFLEEIKLSQNPKQRIFVKTKDAKLEYLLQPAIKPFESNWKTPLLTTRDRMKIVEKIEEVFEDAVSFINHPHWKKSFLEKYRIDS